MQLTVNIQYEQLINIIRQLPANQIAKIKSDLEDIESVSEIKKTDLQSFLLNGPVMSDLQYEAFLENRREFKQWRSK